MIKIIKDQIITNKNPELNCYDTKCPHCKEDGYKEFIGFAPCFVGETKPDTNTISIYRCSDCNGVFAFL